MKDIANIFKLPPDELERKKANLWGKIIPDLEQQEKELQDLQKIHGSDDNDHDRAKDYAEKLENPQRI